MTISGNILAGPTNVGRISNPSHNTSRLRMAACTIISRNYLSHARVLAQSLARHEPEIRFYVLVVDRLPEGVSGGGAMHILDPDELALPYFYEMCFKYDVTELCTALKPSLLALLLGQYADEVIYFDPDILIMRPLEELKERLTSGHIVLTPHLLKPIPKDGRKLDEQDILIAGSYNLGFLALRKSQETDEFLRWWKERLRDGCRVDVARGLMTDQKWIDLIPGLYPSTVILREESYNVAYWNIHSRQIEKRGEEYFVNGRRLAFFHFSGFSPDKPRLFSKHQNRTEINEGSALAALLDHYVKLHAQAGYPVSSRWPYAYSNFDNEIGVHPVMRQLYLGLGEAEKNRFGNPFRAIGTNSFFDWATRPRAREGKLSRFLETIYRARYDLAAGFPDVQGRDHDGFLKWAKTQGAQEMGYDPRLVCAENGESSKLSDESRVMSDEWASRLMTQDSSLVTHHSSLSCVRGINFCGYLRNESGLGSAARGYIRALRFLKVPVALEDLGELSVNRSQDHSLTGFETGHPYDVNVVCVNADQHFVVMEHLGKGFFEGRYNIGIWFWELPRFPEKWHDRFPYYDEIWMGTSFTANMLAPVSPIPVVRVPPVLTQGSLGSRDNGRRRLGLSPEEVVYLFIFDFHSYFQRKNPLALIDAFRKAFAPSDRARLIIKCVNAESDADNFAAMTARAQGYPISIHSGYWSAEEMRDLMAACDVYVSMHRSEGIGLTITDAMALGKPVIATAWSGNMDFMNPSNSFPVRYDLVEIKEDIGPYAAGEMWADPSVEHAAELLRHVFENRDEARARGQTARRDIEANYSEESLAKLIEARLAVIANRSQVSNMRETQVNDQKALKATSYKQLVGRIQDLVRNSLPPDATVIVVSKGDEELLKLDGRQGWHFPRTEDGRYAGYYPADSIQAIAHLERLRIMGGEFLLFPQTALWWLEHYAEFRKYLESHYRIFARQEGDCLIFALFEPLKDPGLDQPKGFRYLQLVQKVQETAASVLPPDATVLVVSNGDDDLLKLKGRKAWHFAQADDGTFAGHHYLDGNSAIGYLEAQRANGASFFVIPRTAFHWLEHCNEFRQHLDNLYQRLWSDECCIIYQLIGPEEEQLKQVQARLDHALATLKRFGEWARETEARFTRAAQSEKANERRLTQLAQSTELRLGELVNETQALAARVEQTTESTEQRLSLVAQSNESRLNEAIAEIRAQAFRLDEVAKNVEQIRYRFAARPYMAKDVFGTADDLAKPMGYGLDAAHLEDASALSVQFSDLFRGTEPFIAERQRIYLPFFHGHRQVVDLGCGRGEFLHLLAEAQIPAVGVELDSSLVQRLRAKGFEVVEADAIEYLQSLPECSLDGIFSAQVIEHVEPKQLTTLLSLAKTRLRPRGVFIAETVNPESFEALKTFHVDLTHQKPIYPQVLLWLCQQAGFPTARIFYPLGGGFTQQNYGNVGEYAVVAMA